MDPESKTSRKESLVIRILLASILLLACSSNEEGLPLPPPCPEAGFSIETPPLAEAGASDASASLPAASVFGFGNSLTLGNATSCAYASNWPCDLQALVGPRYPVASFAKFGFATSDLAPLAETEVDPHLIANVSNVLVFWEGGNDIKRFGDPDAAFERVKTLHLARKKAGWNFTVAVTQPLCDDRHNSVSVYAAHNPDFLKFNERLRQEWTDFADALVDVASDPVLADPTSPLTRTDGVHFTNYGYLRVAYLVERQVGGILERR